MCFIALVCVIPEDIYRRGHVSVLLRFAGRARSWPFGKSGQPTETSAKYVQVLLISSFFFNYKSSFQVKLTDKKNSRCNWISDNDFNVWYKMPYGLQKQNVIQSSRNIFFRFKQIFTFFFIQDTCVYLFPTKQ